MARIRRDFNLWEFRLLEEDYVVDLRMKGMMEDGDNGYQHIEGTKDRNLRSMLIGVVLSSCMSCPTFRLEVLKDRQVKNARRR